MFLQAKEILETHIPGVSVIGVNHPPTQFNVMLSKVLSFVQLALLVVVMGGDFIFPKLGIAPPAIYEWAKERKMMVCMTLWMGGNMLSQNLLSTGAFEVNIGGQTIFSKLSTGRLPGAEELIAAARTLLQQQQQQRGAGPTRAF